MRLIDADALLKCIPIEEYNSRMVVVNAPTIELINREDAIKVIERFQGYLDEDMIYRIKYKLYQDCPSYLCPNCGSYNGGGLDE